MNLIQQYYEQLQKENQKIKVCLAGCTGVVGQVFAWMLAGHQWFEPACFTASSQRAGKSYRDEVHWSLPVPFPENLNEQKIEALDIQALKKKGIRIVFSALPADIARDVEGRLRDEGFFVFSNASAYRYEEHVPILIPEANLDFLSWIEKQGFPGKGFIITNANCSTTGLAVALAPLRRFGIRQVCVSTYQSVSGAGYPGVPSLDIFQNAIPFIKGEENKMEIELQKILGIATEVYPFCVRIPTLFGHLETVWLDFDKKVSPSDIREAWEGFTPGKLHTPSTPERPVQYLEKDIFPQPRQAFWGNPAGQVVFTGRLKQQGNRVGFVLVVNNIVKGAAGGSIQNAEAFIQYYGGGR